MLAALATTEAMGQAIAEHFGGHTARGVRRTFNLMELSQMCSVHSFVPEYSVYGEVLGWFEALLSQLVQHPGGDCCGVCA